MSNRIRILPGSPNDGNRDYLPEAIRGSDMVVNENGNNSQVYPQRLAEYTDTVLDGTTDTWYEYVPESYDGSKKVPLVVSMHGGMMTGWGQAIYTSWTLVADREGFIVLFPNAHFRRFWVTEWDNEALAALTKPNSIGAYLEMPPADPNDNYDLNMVAALIERMKQKYNVDEGRVFMQGMSMGNMMTSQFARYHGELLAAQAGSAGPTCPDVLYDAQGRLINDRTGPLAVFQTRMENDALPSHHTTNMETFVRKNRDYWRSINGCRGIPEIRIEGEDNFAFYKGEHADLVFRDVKNRDHGQTLDDAEIVWDYLFSGTRRNDAGEIVHTDPACPRVGDAYAIALSAGSAKAYVNNQIVTMSGAAFLWQKLKYHGLGGGSIVRGEYFMAPVSFVAGVLGATLSTGDGGCSAELTMNDGRVLQFARGSIGCVMDSRVMSMYCEAVYRDGELYVPIEWICRRVLSNHVSRCDSVIYITDHWAELSANMAQILRDEILI